MAMPNYWNVESVMQKKEDDEEEESRQWDYRYVYGYYHDKPSAR